MRHMFIVIPLLAAGLALLLPGQWRVVSAQAQLELSVLDQADDAVTSLVDGNTVRLRIMADEPATEEVTISFYLDRDTSHLGDCRILAGETGCMTGPLVTLGWYWDDDEEIRPRRQVYAIHYAESGWSPVATVDIAVSPRPVVMVHGLTSSYATWLDYLGPAGFLARTGVPGFAVGDGQAPGEMHTGNILRPAQRTNTIAENAEILRDYIADVKTQTGAEQVDLVVHSMGGLISRYYIDRYMEARDIGQLIMLGTPNGGSDCAVLAGTLGFYQPASLELRTAYLRDVFNPQIVESRGVPFYIVAGVSIQRRIFSPCGEVPNDMVVSLESAVAVPAALTEAPLIHNDLNASEDVYLVHVAPLLRKSPGEFVAAQPATDAPGSIPAGALQFSQVVTGTATRENQTRHTIHIDRDVAVASFGLYDPTRSLTVTVQGATGNEIVLDPDTHGLSVINDPESLLYLGYGFENPRPGPWQVTVHTTERTPPLGAEYALVTLYAGGAAVQGALSDPLPSVGQSVTVSATLELGNEPVDFDRASLTLTHPDGRSEAIPVEASGALLDAEIVPETVGVYGVDVTLSTTLDDGTVAERTLYLAFEALTQATTAAR